MSKEIPRDIELEKSVLGALILDPIKIDEVTNIYKNDFYKDLHQQIYQVITDIHNQDDNEVDLATVAAEVRQRDLEINTQYITNLVDTVVTTENVKHYAKKIRDLSKLRNIIKAGNQIQKLGYSSDNDIDEIINQSEEMLFAISDDNTQSDSELVSNMIMNHLDDIEERKNQGGITGLATPWGKINKATAGLQNGDLVIIAARPSMGKTAMVLNLIDHVSNNLELPSAFFSAEMSRQKIMDRLLAIRGQVNGLNLKSGNLTKDDWKRLSTASNELYNSTINITGNSVRNISEIRSMSRKMKRKQNIKLIAIDFLQLLEGYENEQSRNRQVGNIVKSLKSLAGELDIPIVLLSQLNRSVENRSNKRPLLSDLRDSGEIEEYTDIVMMLYRDDYYNPDSDKKGILEVNLAKNRDGEIGTLELAFKKETQRVLNPNYRRDKHAS